MKSASPRSNRSVSLDESPPKVVNHSTIATAPAPSISGRPRRPGSAHAAINRTAASISGAATVASGGERGRDAGNPDECSTDGCGTKLGLRLHPEPHCVREHDDEHGSRDRASLVVDGITDDRQGDA